MEGAGAGGVGELDGGVRLGDEEITLGEVGVATMVEKGRFNRGQNRC
jgi:hypothetical protein